MDTDRTKTILLVDDNHLVLEVMGRALSNQGFTCLKAYSALKAIDILRAQTPDVILSDYNMPEMDGFQFRQYLMNDQAFKNIPFIFLTSVTDEEVMQQGLNLQVYDYILKDTPVQIVVSKINNILQAVKEQHQQSIKELSGIAQALNLRAIPQNIPSVRGFALNFWHKTFQNYPGGDFIDFIVVSPRYTCVVMGDVMGKKWGAWFFSFSFLSYIRSALRICVYDGNSSTAAILQKINNIICLDPVLNDVLSTLSLVMIDQEEQCITYSGAGDLPMIYYNAEEQKITSIKSAGLLLGVFDNGLYNEYICRLNAGDQLLLITDGITDFEDESGKASDYNKFIEAIRPLMGYADTFERIKNDSFITTKSAEQIDDCSLIFILKEK